LKNRDALRDYSMNQLNVYIQNPRSLN
jgi:hypothetical protein